jgi:hypothetical protein
VREEESEQRLGFSREKHGGRPEATKRPAMLPQTPVRNRTSRGKELKSNEVLAVVAPQLTLLGFEVEAGKKTEEKITAPVLFGLNGRLEKAFDADAYHRAGGFVLEVEAGRGVVNNQFLKDLFQACMMHDVFYLAIAVRNVYKERPDFDVVCRFINTLYASQRLQLPLTGILVIGY